jgi:hypothetical protein
MDVFKTLLLDTPDSLSSISGVLPVANGGTGRSTSTTAYGLIAAGTTATGALQTLATGATTQLLVGGGASALPVWTTATGSGSPVRATSPTLVTPVLGVATATSINSTTIPTSSTLLVSGGALGTPSSGTLTNATGLPISTGVSGLGTGIATALAVNVGSAGAPVVNGGALGTPSSGTVTNLTGTASININGTVGATTPSTGAFTTLSATGNITVANSSAGNLAAYFSYVAPFLAFGDNAVATSATQRFGIAFATSAGNFIGSTKAGDALYFTEYLPASGYVSSNSGNHIFAVANGNSSSFAVVSTISSTGLAVTGALSCTGALSKGSGSFRIDHPLPEKNATHQLVHSFIEGPKADLIYRGVAKLANGIAAVNIDTVATMTKGTFVALCRDVQAFVTNNSDWSPVRATVSGNVLTIECQDTNSTAEVSWLVIGERQDQHMMDTEWTDDNGRVIVEPLKPILEDN